jgi:uncharacterized membrane protein YfcA
MNSRNRGLRIILGMGFITSALALIIVHLVDREWDNVLLGALGLLLGLFLFLTGRRADQRAESSKQW